MHRLLCCLSLAVLLATSGTAWAQGAVEVVFTSSPSPVGSGARATGLGSAFTAVADDATAASWNPAGLIQLERPEVSAVARAHLQVDELGTFRSIESFGSKTIVAGTDSAESLGLNFVSATLPFSVRGQNVVISLNYHEVFGFERDIGFDVFIGSTESTEPFVVRIQQEGSLYAVTPALAVELAPWLSVGATIDHVFDGVGRTYAWRSTDTLQTPEADGSISLSTDQPTFHDVSGTGATLGVLARAGSRLSFGGVVRVPFQAHFELDDRLVATGASGSRHDRLAMEFPLSFGFGGAYRWSDSLVAAVDAMHVAWSEFRIYDSAGQAFVYTGDKASDVSVDDVWTIRAGVEHLTAVPGFTLALRGGAFYDPEPTSGAPSTFWGLTTGVGIALDDFSVDVAYQFRFGLGVSGSSVTVNALSVREGEIDVFQHDLYFSIITYF